MVAVGSGSACERESSELPYFDFSVKLLPPHITNDVAVNDNTILIHSNVLFFPLGGLYSSGPNSANSSHLPS